MNSKQKATIIIIIALTLLLSFACKTVDDGDPTPTATPAVDETCWKRVYDECVDAGNGIWTCNEHANKSCGD